MSYFESSPVYETPEETKFWEAIEDPNFRDAALASGEYIPTATLLQRWEAGELDSGDVSQAAPEQISA